MKKFLAALLLMAAGAANAAWVAAWSDAGGIIYYENTTMSFSGPVQPGTNPFIRATIYTNYQNVINNSNVCYPSASDCQWKRVSTTATYDWSCNNVIRLVTNDEQWDSGPTSESFSRDTYTAPAQRQYVQAPTPVAPGGVYNISNLPNFMAVQAVICAYWPK
jgi:hypothetical protein